MRELHTCEMEKFSVLGTGEPLLRSLSVPQNTVQERIRTEAAGVQEGGVLQSQCPLIGWEET